MRGLLTQGQYLFVEREGRLAVQEDFAQSHSEDDLNSSDAEETYDGSSHNYVDVMAHRLNDVDQRLLKYAVDMNLPDPDQKTNQAGVAAPDRMDNKNRQRRISVVQRGPGDLKDL